MCSDSKLLLSKSRSSSRLTAQGTLAETIYIDDKRNIIPETPQPINSIYIIYHDPQHWGMTCSTWYSTRSSSADCTIQGFRALSELLPLDLRTKYGAPISRRRIYLIMIQKTVMNETAKSQGLCDFIKSRLDEMKVNARCGWTLVLVKSIVEDYRLCYNPTTKHTRNDLLLSLNHPAVVRDMEKRWQRRLKIGAQFLGTACPHLIVCVWVGCLWNQYYMSRIFSDNSHI